VSAPTAEQRYIEQLEPLLLALEDAAEAVRAYRGHLNHYHCSIATPQARALEAAMTRRLHQELLPALDRHVAAADAAWEE
jgi:hypothetical protein